MKKYFIALYCCCLLFSLAVQAQEVVVHVTSGYIDTLLKKYPVKRFSRWPDCYRWDNPYFQSIADIRKHEAKVVHAIYTKAMARAADSLNYARKLALADWRSLPGMPDEDKVYAKANVGRPAATKLHKGHFSAWELNAYSLDAVLLSDTYTFNAAFEMGVQNTGTELGVEYLQRILVSEIKGRHRPSGLPFYDQVEYWKGAWGTKGSFTDGQITSNYPAVYWNLLRYGDQLHAFWFPNDASGAGQKNYPLFEIPYTTLVQRLGWDPVTIFNQN
jgi:hypothetical protein